jgi:peroxiredoxin
MNTSGNPSAGEARTPAIILIAVALVVSVALNVVLAHRVRNVMRAHRIETSERLLRVGAIAPPIAAKDLGGQRELISYYDSRQPTVLYIFTPTCSWCARNMDNLKTLVEEESGPYRFIGISLSEEGLAEYIKKNDLKLPIYSGLSNETKQAYKLSGTPQTIVISPESKVLQDWMGAYVGDQKSQVEAFFHVSLPGLKPAPSSQLTGGE